MKILSLFLVFCSLLAFSCDFFNPNDPDFLNNLYEELAYANAPWVSLYIEAGDLGITSLMGSQPQTVKLGYSFNLVLQPSREYPFNGWQAWIYGDGIIAEWKDDDTQTGIDKVKFVPKNAEGTEVEIFVYVKPEEGSQLYIGPWGATADNLTGVTLNVSPAQGTSSPPAGALVNLVKQGLSFPISYFPLAEFQFQNWEAGYPDENNIWRSKTNDEVMFESPNSTNTNVIVNTKDPVVIRPVTARRPFVEATNLIWGRPEFTDFAVMIQFSREMDPDSFNWDTISVTSTVGSNVIEHDEKTIELRYSEFDNMLTLTPLRQTNDDYLRPNSRVVITIRRLMIDFNEIAVRSAVRTRDGTPLENGGISLADDIVIRYFCGHSKAPNKPKFAPNTTVRFATKSGNTWTIWDGDMTTYRNTAAGARVPADKQVYLIFLPDADTNVAGIRITESLIRQPGASNASSPDDTEIIRYSSRMINIGSANVDPSLANHFSYTSLPLDVRNRAIAVLYTMESDNNSWITRDYHGGVRLRVELFDGISYSDAALTGVEGPQVIQTKYNLSFEQMSAMKQITGAATIAGASFDGFDEGFEEGSIITRYKYFVNIDARPVFSLLRTPHSLPFFTPVSGLLREVTIPNYRLGETQVTQKHWETIRLWALANGYTNISVGTNRTNGDNFPVTGITWRDMIVWCNAYSEANNLTPVYVNNSGIVFKNGTSDDIDYTTLGNFWQNDNFRSNWHTRNGFRLPFEMEWDYAARGGNSTTTEMGVPWNFGYSGSNIWQEVANFSGTIQTVRQRAANTLGLFDMSGNVDEWVWDSGAGGYGHDTIITGPYHISSVVNNRIFRGGNFSSTGNAQLLTHHGRDFARGEAAPTTSAATRGFRVARNGW